MSRLIAGRNGWPAASAHFPQLDRWLLEHHPKFGGFWHQVNHCQTRIFQDGHACRRLPALRTEHLRSHLVHSTIVGCRHGRSHLRVRNRIHLLLRGKPNILCLKINMKYIYTNNRTLHITDHWIWLLIVTHCFPRW